ncbi:MAG: glycosyltransferase family 4 protein, partial [Gammaproteobacteria bacterium]
MHIVFLSHYFPPEVNAPATRTYEHCKEWIRNGHQVTVVTCVPNHPRGKIYPGYKNRLYQVEEKDGIKVVRLWTYVTANEGFLKRTLNYISYKISAILATPFIGKADVVVSTSPQFFNGLAGYVVSRLKGAPWILEIRDLWPESILTVGAINNKHVIRFLEWLEMFAYRKADRIVPVTNAFKD